MRGEKYILPVLIVLVLAQFSVLAAAFWDVTILYLVGTLLILLGAVTVLIGLSKARDEINGTNTSGDISSKSFSNRTRDLDNSQTEKS